MKLLKLRRERILPLSLPWARELGAFFENFFTSPLPCLLLRRQKITTRAAPKLMQREPKTMPIIGPTIELLLYLLSFLLGVDPSNPLEDDCVRLLLEPLAGVGAGAGPGT